MKCDIGIIADNFFENHGLKDKFSDMRASLNFGNKDGPIP
jgi:hypothetical protein